MKKKRNFLRKLGLISLLILISAFPPLSTDIYLPALPQLTELLNTSQAMVNLTLAMFFIFFAGGSLFWGPLSDKYGRKPVLLIGLALYTMASLGCAFSSEIGQLILCRIVQGFAGSAPAVVAIAIVKDLFDGRARQRILTLIYSIVVVAPILGPVIGAVLMEYVSWRAIFQLLADIGLVAFLGSAFIKETRRRPFTGSIRQNWAQLVAVLFRPKFSLPLFVFSMIPMSIITFIATSAYIYIDDFGMNELQFGYLLAFNGFFTLIGPLLYTRLVCYFKTKNIILAGFTLFAFLAVFTIACGHLNVYLFAILMGCASLSLLTIRVPVMNMVLDQRKIDAGSASGLLSFVGMLMGSIGMYLVILYPGGLIVALGAVNLAIGVAGGLVWLSICNKPFIQNVLARAA
ncbi:multidrug effflux MFS transporter [Verrucomicrobia bacterium]|nr:multidrug effflux MFS transporter [Verrucomicrobiota bacterium]